MWQPEQHGAVSVVRLADAPVQLLEPGRAWALLDTLVSGRLHGHWVVDMSQERILTSESLAVIIDLVRRVQNAGGRMVFAGCRPGVINILTSMRLVKLVPLYDDVPAAVAGLCA